MATPATPPASIGEALKIARTQRDAITKELKKIQNGGQSANETARFEKVERLMQNFRLGCVGMILLETRAADEMDVENLLWMAHSDVARVYKGVIENLVATDHVVVLKRKLEKLYHSYLRTAQLFYKGLLQRMCATHNMKELNRIARLAEVEDIPIPDNGIIDAEAKKVVERIATDTCHKILVHLGDLSRYRTDARPNDRQWSGALTYYALANDLIPESGYGHHQCGVVHLRTGNHLEVVYHFYRALVGEKRHPHALTNLDVQFKRLRQGKAGVASNDAMISWFVKLHANYFQGDPFNGQQELEDEVDTRLAMALKKGPQSDLAKKGSRSDFLKKDSQSDLDMDLLKMILINILAYQVSLEKAKSDWTNTASRSCQFILLQNIRTIHTISRLLLDELVEIVHRKPVEFEQATGQFSPTFHRVLPLLRVYMAWLCFNSANVVEYKDHLEPRFGQMCKTLAHVLNLLFELLTSDISNIKKQVPWRLPEDEETLGMECLNGPGLPIRCQLCLDPISLEPKPRAEEFKDVTYTADQISYTRILNVISCAVSLANQSPFPIVLSKILEGPKESSRFVYTEGGRINPSFQPDHPPSFDYGSASSALVAVPDVVQQQHLQYETALIQATVDDSDEFSEDQDFYGAPGQNSTSLNNLASLDGFASRAAPAEFPVEYQLYNIISDLLAPPEPDPTTKSPEAQPVTPKQIEHNGDLIAAGKPFGSPLPISPSLGPAGPPKPIPTLPWNYFYTPAPVEGSARSASGNSPGWENPLGPVGSRPSTARNATPVLALEGKNSTLAFRSAGQARNSGEPSPIQPGGHRTSTSELAGLDSLSGPDFTEHINNTLKGYGHGARDAWTGARINTTSNAPPANPWGAPAGRWELGQHSPVGQTVPPSSFSSLSFSGMESSLPPVNSPWGVSMKAPQPALRTEQSPIWRDHIRSPSGLVNEVNGSSSIVLAQSNMDRNSTPGLPSPIGAYDSMASYAHGNDYPTGLPASSVNSAPQLDEYHRQQASMNAWINDYQPKMTPPPGLMSPATGPFVSVRQGQAVRAGGGDLLKSATIQKPWQQPGNPLPSIREPFGPGANGRTNFSNIHKR